MRTSSIIRRVRLVRLACLACFLMSLAAAPAFAQAPGGGGQVLSCDYYAKRIRDMDDCISKNNAAARQLGGGQAVAPGKKQKGMSMADTYTAAAQACANARMQYQAKLAQCQTGGGGPGGGPGGGGPGGPGGRPQKSDPSQQLQQMLQQLNEQQRAQIQQAISGIQGATKGLGPGYGGAGVQGDIPGLPDAGWSDDSLADLGDAYPTGHGTSGDGGSHSHGNDPIDGSIFPDELDFDDPAAPAPTDPSPSDTGDEQVAPMTDGLGDDSDNFLDEPLMPDDAQAPSEPAPTGDEEPRADLTDTGNTTDEDLGNLASEEAQEESAMPQDASPSSVDGVPLDTGAAEGDGGYVDPGPDLGGADDPTAHFAEDYSSNMQWTDSESRVIDAGQKQADEMGDVQGFGYEVIAQSGANAASCATDPNCERNFEDTAMTAGMRRMPIVGDIMEFNDNVNSAADTVTRVWNQVPQLYDNTKLTIGRWLGYRCYQSIGAGVICQ